MGRPCAAALGRPKTSNLLSRAGGWKAARVTFHVTGPHGGVFHFELRVEEDTLKGTLTRTMGDETEHGTIELKRVR